MHKGQMLQCIIAQNKFALIFAWTLAVQVYCSHI